MDLQKTNHTSLISLTDKTEVSSSSAPLEQIISLQLHRELL